jgi:hypothetical protein
MRARHAWATLAALIAMAGPAAADHINGSFAAESRSSGSAVIRPAPAATLPPVVVQPGQPIIVQQPGQPAPPAPPAPVVRPAPPALVVQPGAQMIQAEDLEANEVRANTIYANKIEAREIQGAIHPAAEVRLGGSVSDIKAATVVASILYADTIKAHRVVADHIYVQEIERD